MQIDLGAPDRLAAVAVWHFHAEARVYHAVVVQASNDPAFKTGVTTLFNNDDTNADGLGKGTDYAYVETYKGRVIDAKGVDRPLRPPLQQRKHLGRAQPLHRGGGLRQARELTRPRVARARRPPCPRILSRWLPLVAADPGGALAAGTGPRAARPMHADEANQAVKAGELLESGRYAFDPRDHHGPMLYYAVLPVAWLRGQRTLAGLDEVTVRLVPALAGAASVFLLGLLAAPLGPLALARGRGLPGRVAPRGLLQPVLHPGDAARGPSRWRPSSALAGGGARAGRAGPAAAGACLGLMLATKESAPLFALAALAAYLAARAAGGRASVRQESRRAPASPGAAAALAVAAAVLLLVWRAPLRPARRDLAPTGTLARRLAAPGHRPREALVVFPAGSSRGSAAGGLVFEQVGFAVLVLAGLGVAPASGGPPLLRWAAAYSGLVLVALSATPYKTPWHAVHLVAGLRAPGRRRRRRAFAGEAAAGGLAGRRGARGARDAWPSRPTGSTRAYASDARNPYRLRPQLAGRPQIHGPGRRRARAAPGGPVRVISEEYWPLPWYFRGLGRVGYWTRPPADCDGALVVASAGQADAVRSRLHGAYAESYLGLRPGFVCVVFTPRQ